MDGWEWLATRLTTLATQTILVVSNTILLMIAINTKFNLPQQSAHSPTGKQSYKINKAEFFADGFDDNSYNINEYQPIHWRGFETGKYSLTNN